MRKYFKLISKVLTLFMITMIATQSGYSKVNAEENNSYTTIVNDSNIGEGINQFKYYGTWGVSTGYPQFYNGDEHWSNAASWNGTPENIYYTVKFEGTKIDVYGNKQPGLGIYAVSIDGGEEVEVDAYNQTSIYQQLIYSSPELEEGVHTLKVRATGKKTGSAPDMQVDYAKIYHSKIEAREVELSSNDITIESGMSHQLLANVIPQNASDREIVWSSENEAVATVENGMVEGISEGSTKIRATVKDTSIYAECNVTITKAGSILSASVGSPDRHYMQGDYEEVRKMAQTSWSGIGWIGDILNSEIVLWTKGKDVENAKLTSSNFVNSDGSVIDSSNIELTFLKEVSAHVGRGFSWGNIPGSNVPREMVPDVLYTSEPINIAKERVQPVWVNINIPRDAKPGIYTGEINVEADGLEEVIALRYSFEVLDVTQPKATDNEFHLELWQYPYTFARYYEVEPFSEEFFEKIKPQMESYRDAGGKSITTTIVEDPWNQQTYDKYPSMVKWTKKADGTFEYDFDHFDKWVQFNLDLGITKQITAFSMIPWDNRIIYFDEAQNRDVQEKPSPGSVRWNELWNDFLDEFVIHLDEKGWFEKTYIAMDERPLSTMIPVLDLLDKKPNKDGETLKVSGAMNYKSLDKTILDRIEDISINLGHVNHNNDDVRELTEHRKSLGLNTTLYTCVGDYPSSFTRSNPSESAWTIWYSASQGTNGYLRWAFDAWVKDPLTSVDHWYWESGDPFFVYPGDKNDEVPTPRSTPRYERLQEGIRDVEKLNYIKRNTTELNDEIDALLGSIQRAYGKTNPWGANEAGSQANKDLIDSEVARLRAGLMDITRQYIEIRDKEEAEIVVSKVQNLQVNEVTKDSVTLNWEVPKTIIGLQEYVIYKDGKEVATVPAAELTFVDTELKANTIYGFKVVAKYSNGEKSKPVSLNVRTLR